MSVTSVRSMRAALVPLTVMATFCCFDAIYAQSPSPSAPGQVCGIGSNCGTIPVRPADAGAAAPLQSQQPHELLPVKAGDFQVKFNEITARAGLFDIKAVPVGCRSRRICEYRVGEHSIITVVGAPERGAVEIHMKSSARSRAQGQMVFSTIVALTELAAPERSERDRMQVVRTLLNRAESVWAYKYAAKAVCEDLGSSGHWQIMSVLHEGELEVTILQPAGCPHGWRE
jgi:hypothetical protein